MAFLKKKKQEKSFAGALNLKFIIFQTYHLNFVEKMLKIILGA